MHLLGPTSFSYSVVLVPTIRDHALGVEGNAKMGRIFIVFITISLEFKIVITF